MRVQACAEQLESTGKEMSTALQIFTHEIGERSVSLNALLVGEDPWFRANDAALALEYKNTRQAIRTHVRDEDRQTLENLRGLETSLPLEHNEGAQVFINESGLYSLIMKSRKAEALDFQRWVTSEVLPSIRRTGRYESAQPPQQPSVEASATPRRSAHLQDLAAACQLAQVINSTSRARLHARAQEAIDDLLLPEGDSRHEYVDAEQILRDRAYTEEQIRRLAGEFGKALKLAALHEEHARQSSEQRFGADRKQVGRFHRTQDAGLAEDVLAMFRQRDLHRRVLANEEDPVARRKREARQQVLQNKGRGWKRSRRTGGT